MKNYIKKFGHVLEISNQIIECIEDHADYISAELKGIKSWNDENPKKCNGYDLLCFKIKKKLVNVMLCPSSRYKSPETSGLFSCSKKENRIVFFRFPTEAKKLEHLSRNFYLTRLIVHETIHAFQKLEWGTLRKSTSNVRKTEIEAAVFEIPIGLAIFMIRGSKMNVDDYENFFHRLLYVQTSMPYYRMKEVREILLANKDFIWQYAKELELKYSDYDPVSGEYIGENK